jgi:D-tagatose-bisphosphate aldolase class II non-catalytic subunit
METIDFNGGIGRNRAGQSFAFTSVCSAHPDVLEASIRLARVMQLPIVIEATSNQVNQFGGYTGMRPADFVALVRSTADRLDVGSGQIIFGGDHLGPQAWRDRPADEAMLLAEDMMADYVRAGFTKIHLDCSEGCAGEPAQVGDIVAAQRAARLARACETAAGDRADALSYIIGTEVPPPGGARADDADGILPTAPHSARMTLNEHHAAFQAAGIGSTWRRVRGLVVQPGLEFAPDHVDRFDMAQPDLLSPVLGGHPGLCFEAHSTDYQYGEVFGDLARRHFAILKVGPALTFAYREAVYALSAIDSWISDTPHISALLETKMVAAPAHWQKHYHGGETRLRLLRHFGYADRIRYYWADREVSEAVAALEARIDTADLPEPLLLQYIDELWRADAARLVKNGLGTAKAFIQARIQRALRPYLEVIG